jgi:lipid-binding SYLF domain-containing protein
MGQLRTPLAWALPALLLAAPLAAGIFGPKGESADEKREVVREERDKMLERLFEEKPELREELAEAPGYGAFSNRQMNLFLMASGNGYGVVVDNRNGKETFMRVASIGAGVGAGVKDIDVVFLFNDSDTMRTFVEDGWQFGAHADATAEVKGEGGGIGEAGAVDTAGSGGVSGGASAVLDVDPPMEIYELTDVGVALQAVVAGTKYWQDGKLNDL